MKNLHLVEVKYLPATNHNGSRVKLTSHRLNESVTFAFDYQLNNVVDMAEKYLLEKGQNIIGRGNGKDNDYIIIDSKDNQFESIK